MPVARSHWITPVLFAFVSLLAPSVVSAQTEAASKTTEEVFEHQALKARIGIGSRLAAHGVRAEQLPRLAELAAADFTNGTNPRPATATDYERLLRQAM